MTDTKYTGCSIDELIEDKEFVAIVKRIQTNEAWEQFLQLHKGSKRNIIKAREIILLFKTNNGTLSNERKYGLWKNISSFSQEHSRMRKIARIKTYSKVAASILIILSLGSLLYLNFNKDVQEYKFSDSQIQLKPDTPILVLSNGDQVNLQKSGLNLTVLKNQNAIQIDSDSIINNQPAIDKTTKEVRLNEVIIPFGKKSKLLLSDGTIVWLNAGSRFAFPQKFEGKERAVFLEGEGYFEVAKNADQPFIVSTSSVAIKVLGTKFNVSAYQSDHFIETFLLEGRVSISANGKLFNDKIIMIPDQKATYNKIQKNFELKPEQNPEVYIAWVEGWYQFSNESLEQVFTKLGRYYNVSFEYDQSSISRALPVSGKLDLKDSLNEVMVVLSGVAKIKYQIVYDKVTIIH